MRSRISSLLILMLIMALTMQCAKEEPQVDMEQIAKAWNTTYNSHDVEAFVNLFTDDIVYGIVSGTPRVGKDAVAENFKNTFKTFSDIHMELELIFTSGEYIACKHVVSGTFTNTWIRQDEEIAPTGKKAVVPMVSILKVSPDGLIAEVTDYWDNADLLKQLGVEQ